MFPSENLYSPGFNDSIFSSFPYNFLGTKKPRLLGVWFFTQKAKPLWGFLNLFENCQEFHWYVHAIKSAIFCQTERLNPASSFLFYHSPLPLPFLAQAAHKKPKTHCLPQAIPVKQLDLLLPQQQ